MGDVGVWVPCECGMWGVGVKEVSVWWRCGEVFGEVWVWVWCGVTSNDLLVAENFSDLALALEDLEVLLGNALDLLADPWMTICHL